MSMGKIFDIQRFSTENGPGIRTTVFLKGCALRCVWCSNPEGQQEYSQYMWDEQLCAHCGKCGNDPRRLVGKRPKGDIECLRGALHVCGQEMSADDVFRTVMADKAYYLRSGGGMTLSGGECLLQKEFTLSLLNRCKENGIHTALDTCLFAERDAVRDSLDVTDLYLADLKHMDSDIHRKFTGQGNERILENLDMVLSRGKRTWIRIPVIRGFNDSEENFRKTAEFLKRYPAVEEVDLLPAHALSERKYCGLGLIWIKPEKTDDSEMRKYAGILENNGIKTVIKQI